MSGEAVVVFGTQKTLEAAGVQITSNSVAPADDAVYGIAADGASFPDAEFSLTCTFAGAPASNAIVSLYAAPQDIDGTLDADPPESSRPSIFVGTFAVKATTSSQTIPLTGVVARDLPAIAYYYLHNNTAVTINAGWSLKIKPRSYKAAP